MYPFFFEISYFVWRSADATSHFSYTHFQEFPQGTITGIITGIITGTITGTITAIYIHDDGLSRLFPAAYREIISTRQNSRPDAAHFGPLAPPVDFFSGRKHARPKYARGKEGSKGASQKEVLFEPLDSGLFQIQRMTPAFWSATKTPFSLR